MSKEVDDLIASLEAKGLVVIKLTESGRPDIIAIPETAVESTEIYTFNRGNPSLNQKAVIESLWRQGFHAEFSDDKVTGAKRSSIDMQEFAEGCFRRGFHSYGQDGRGAWPEGEQKKGTQDWYIMRSNWQAGWDAAQKTQEDMIRALEKEQKAKTDVVEEDF